jgi:nitroimidazol reductase NimA-like FMN-containing flavoprotein (pyridoxamine 5'-phosphate oxidase superfamily)
MNDVPVNDVPVNDVPTNDLSTSGVEALLRLQAESFARADRALRGSWSTDRAMGPAELDAFLAEHVYCVLATTTGKGRPQARPVAFAVFRDAFWFATVEGGRLRNVQSTPWVSVVISEGDGDRHRMVAVDGPVTVTTDPPDGLLEHWEQRMGSHPAWAKAWIELRPDRLFSYSSA